MPSSLENDLRAIHALNQRDVEAVLTSDTEKLISNWSDDFTVLPQAGPIIRGRPANVEIVQKASEQMRAFECIEFVVDFEEIEVVGDYAFEWGTYRGKSRPRAGGDPIAFGGKLMRILQRQSDGAWKMYRSMGTNDPAV